VNQAIDSLVVLDKLDVERFKRPANQHLIAPLVAGHAGVPEKTLRFSWTKKNPAE
jgi:hypothetical protein